MGGDGCSRIRDYDWAALNFRLQVRIVHTHNVRLVPREKGGQTELRQNHGGLCLFQDERRAVWRIGRVQGYIGSSRFKNPSTPIPCPPNAPYKPPTNTSGPTPQCL